MKSKLKEWLGNRIEWIKTHPSALISLALVVVFVMAENVIIGMAFSDMSVISTKMLSEVLAMSSEVVAGLYGLTLTGYIFFIDRLQQRAEDDELLEDIITLLKRRYHNMVLILSSLCFLVIVMAINFIIYNPDANIFSVPFYRLWGYETIFLVCIALLFNIYFVITVVDPDKISRASLKYKQKISNSDTELGSLQEFLQDYEVIERIIIEKLEGLAVSHIGTNPWKAIRHLNGREKIEIKKILSDPLLKKVMIVGQYYSYMVFSQEMTVTQEMCNMARSVKDELRGNFDKATN